MNAIVLTGASTSMARARDRGYRDHRRARINLKFNPASIAGEEGMRGLMQVSRAFWEPTLWPVQFNVINNQTLIAAEEGMRRRCVGQGTQARNLGFPIPAGKLARRQSATKP